MAEKEREGVAVSEGVHGPDSRITSPPPKKSNRNPLGDGAAG